MKNEWVSVKTKLPETNISVLAASYKPDDRINYAIYVAWIEKFGLENKPIWQYSWCCGCYCGEEITHWMVLPEPPEM